jgi:hypothetical protein
MRFIALLRKELRECLPWMLFAAVFLTVFGGIALWGQTRPENINSRYPWFAPGTINTYGYNFIKAYPVSQAGVFLFMTSIGLGLILGVRQFQIENVTRTWGFLLQRSINRGTVLLSKLSAAVIVFIISQGLIWCFFFWYSRKPGLFAVRSSDRVFVEGWIFVILGFIAYLGTALSCLNSAKWYTTRLFSLLFTALMIVIVAGQWSLLGAFIFIAVATLILLSQLTETFLSREF